MNKKKGAPFGVWPLTVAVLSAVVSIVLVCLPSDGHASFSLWCVSVVDTLLGGASAGVVAAVATYAVCGTVAVLCALMSGMLWKSLSVFSTGVRLLPIGIATAAVSVAAVLMCSVTEAVGALGGSVLCVLGILAYAKLQNICPKVFNRETVSYIVFGVLTTVVSFVSQMLFASMGTPAWVNTIGSWVCAVIFAYVVNKLFVFESKTDSAAAFWRELGLFVAARLASLGMELVFMIVTVDVLGFSEAVCKLIAQVFILVANYVFSKLFIFKKSDK